MEVVSALPLEVDPESLLVATEVHRARRDAATNDAPVLPPPGAGSSAAQLPFLEGLVEGLGGASYQTGV